MVKWAMIIAGWSAAVVGLMFVLVCLHGACLRYLSRKTALEVVPGIPSRRGMALLKARVLAGSKPAVILTLKGGAYLYAVETLRESNLGAIAFVNSIPWDSVVGMEWDNGKPFGQGSAD